jgi:hypothetical protein
LPLDFKGGPPAGRAGNRDMVAARLAPTAFAYGPRLKL